MVILAFGWDVVAGGGLGFETCRPANSCQPGSVGDGDGQFSQPVDVAVDLTGTVFVLDAGNNRVQKFDGQGHYLSDWGIPGSRPGQFNAPSGITTDASGGVYVTDSLNFRVQKFDSASRPLAQWGAPGSGDGQFSHARGLAVDDRGRVFVSDVDNNRIQVFTPDSAFVLHGCLLYTSRCV